MRIPFFALPILLVNVKAASTRVLPYYIKAYIRDSDKQNYKSVVKEIDCVLGEVIKGEAPVKKVTLKIMPYFKNCESLIKNWVLRWNLLLAHNVEYDPFSTQLTIDELMSKHCTLAIQHIQESKVGKAFIDKWALRFFWLQEFVDALHVAVMLRSEGDGLKMEMLMFKQVIRCSTNWLNKNEKDLQKNFCELVRTPPHFCHYTLQELERMSSSIEQLPFDLLLKNAQYYRALNMLDVNLYSFEDINAYSRSSKMLRKSLMHQSHRHLSFLIQRMKHQCNQIKIKWKQGKRTQLGEDYKMVEIMWSSWYGLALPTVNALKSMQGFAANSLIDFLNFGLKGTIFASTVTDYSEGHSVWDFYLSSLDVGHSA